jgi:hypothetical protein
VADARTGKRFPVKLPIRIHVDDSDEAQAGTTANVSSAGVFIKASAPAKSKRKAAAAPPWRKGSVVEFEMVLPAEVIGAQEDVHVQCRGRVVRVEKSDKSHPEGGVACVIDNYEFVRKS